MNFANLCCVHLCLPVQEAKRSPDDVTVKGIERRGVTVEDVLKAKVCVHTE